MFNLIITGGGTQCIPQMLENGGGSEFLNQVIVPYSNESLSKYLGYTPTKSCDRNTTLDMVMKGFDDKTTIAVNATLRRKNYIAETHSDGSKREHKAYLAKHCNEFTHLKAVTLSGLTRLEQERELSNNILTFIWDNSISYGITFNENKVLSMVGKIAENSCIFPGSFNPIHDGHKKIIELMKFRGFNPILEVSLVNVDKPAIDYIRAQERMNSIRTKIKSPVCITKNATFIRKMNDSPNSTFIVGLDTLARLNNPAYSNIDEVNECIKNTNSHFFVFDRMCDWNYDLNKVNNCTYIKEYEDQGHSSTKERLCV